MTSPAPDDAALLRGVADGDERALRTLFERHAPWLRIRLTRRCGDPDAVADVLQDTFVAVVVGALWHDRGGRTAGLRAVGIALVVAAVVTCLLAMFTGVDATLVNPILQPR